MVRAEAIKKGDGVDVSTEVDGVGTDIIEEALSIVKAIYDGFEERNRDMAIMFAALVGELDVEQIEGLTQGVEKDDTYA